MCMYRVQVFFIKHTTLCYWLGLFVQGTVWLAIMPVFDCYIILKLFIFWLVKFISIDKKALDVFCKLLLWIPCLVYDCKILLAGPSASYRIQSLFILPICKAPYFLVTATENPQLAIHHSQLSSDCHTTSSERNAVVSDTNIWWW